MKKILSLCLAITMLFSLSISVYAEGKTQTFSDVSPNAWYYDAVEFAAKKGIVNGVGDGKFAPNSTMTRYQFVTILTRYLYPEQITEMQASTKEALNQLEASKIAISDYLDIINFCLDGVYEKLPEDFYTFPSITYDNYYNMLYSKIEEINRLSNEMGNDNPLCILLGEDYDSETENTSETDYIDEAVNTFLWCALIPYIYSEEDLEYYIELFEDLKTECEEYNNIMTEYSLLLHSLLDTWYAIPVVVAYNNGLNEYIKDLYSYTDSFYTSDFSDISEIQNIQVEFYPNDFCTRDDMAACIEWFLSNTISKEEIEGLKVSYDWIVSTTGDNLIPDIEDCVNKDSVKLAVMEGIIAGVDEKGTFNPKGIMTRGQACTVIHRLLDEDVRVLYD